MYYQVNATYFSALGEDEKKLLLARAIQIFTPGIPQVWYLDLFAGKNDHEAVKKTGAGGHKEINRTNLTVKQAESALKLDIIRKQIGLLKFRNTFPVFSNESKLLVHNTEKHILKISWENNTYNATLEANLKTFEFIIYNNKDKKALII
jgi:sucrose phosphorylase